MRRGIFDDAIIKGGRMNNARVREAVLDREKLFSSSGNKNSNARTFGYLIVISPKTGYIDVSFMVIIVIAAAGASATFGKKSFLVNN